jgi:broad specificity phosphatase PhoE
MSRLVILRHSLALANEQGILMGAKLDSPLSEKGKEIARQKGISLRAEGFAPNRVYTSKLSRAVQTADIILQELGSSVPITRLDALNERDFGKHDGKPYKFVIEAFEKYGDNPPTIEHVQPFVNRVISALETIKLDTTDTTLVVTHSNPVMVMQTAIFEPDKLTKFWELGDPAYCQGFVYDF